MESSELLPKKNSASFYIAYRKTGGHKRRLTKMKIDRMDWKVRKEIIEVKFLLEFHQMEKKSLKLTKTTVPGR